MKVLMSSQRNLDRNISRNYKIRVTGATFIVNFGSPESICMKRPHSGLQESSRQAKISIQQHQQQQKKGKFSRRQNYSKLGKQGLGGHLQVTESAQLQRFAARTKKSSHQNSFAEILLISLKERLCSWVHKSGTNPGC